MKRIVFVLSLLLTFGFSLQGAAAAQLDFDEYENPQDVPGLQSAYNRTYAADYEALLASPDADISAAIQNVSILAFVFEDDESAKAFYDEAADQVDDVADDTDTEGVETTVSDLEGVDKDGWQVTIDMAEAGMGVSLIAFLDGNSFFILTVVDADSQAALETATTVANYIVDTDASDDEVTFNEDGTSTGGVFARLPESGSDEVNGLVAESDIDLFAQDAG